MPTIETTTIIAAPLERVFDLARSIDLHTLSTSETSERAIRGITSELIGPDEEVTWRAKHFGIWQELTVRITGFDRPTFFQDTMLKGAFKSMSHDHFFEFKEGITIMRDRFTFESPLGPLGKLANRLFLERYMRRFILRRNEVLKSIAESDNWHRFLRDQ